MIKIVVIGRNKTELEAVIIALSTCNNFQVVETGKNISEILKAAQPQPDVIIMDVQTARAAETELVHSLSIVSKDYKNLFPVPALFVPAGMRLPVLSALEKETINASALGICDKKFASDLNIATNTIRNYMTTIRRKTGLQTRVQIVLYALMFGIIEWAPVQQEILRTLSL